MKATLSNFPFLRSWVAIVLGIVGVGLLLELFLARLGGDDAEDELRRTYAPLFDMVSRSLLDHPPESRATLLAELSQTWEFSAQLIPLASFAGPEAEQPELDFTRVMLFFDNERHPLLYRQLPGTDLVIALGPLATPGSSANTVGETWIISAYYLLVAIVVLLWIRPFSRDLTLLRAAAADFGRADFSARVRLRDNSSILPVATSFNAMAERIEYLVSAHKELTNAVSHELRTPLARFKFTMEILARNNDPDRKQRYLEQMKLDVQELETLIDEMLTYARLGERNLMLIHEEVDLKQWLERELRVYERETITVTCSYACTPTDTTFRATMNPDLMARALHNVIRNGLRYARESINLHLHCNGAIMLRICDDGPGIPPDKHASIFEPFSRLETSRDRQSGGYGLGLAIAARILQRHGGSISVTNVEPHGACFVFEWPRQPAS